VELEGLLDDRDGPVHVEAARGDDVFLRDEQEVRSGHGI
jgi:hypothetical protein